MAARRRIPDERPKRVYRSTRIDGQVLNQVGELIEEIKKRGTGSLPPELQPFFGDGLNASAVLEAALELFKERWSETRERP